MKHWLLSIVLSSLPVREDLKGYLLDFSFEKPGLTAVASQQVGEFVAQAQTKAEIQNYDGMGRELGYQGEERGPLFLLLGLKPENSRSWLYCPDLDFRAIGLATQVEGEKGYSRALLVPVDESRWLLLLSPAASLEEEKLRSHLQAAKLRAKLHSKITNLFCDAIAARNSGQKKPLRWGYLPLGDSPTLEVGDPESEKEYSLHGQGEVRRKLEKLQVPDGGNWVDDGLSTGKSGGSIFFELDLHSLVADDLLLIGRSSNSNTGRVFVDGIPLADWKPEQKQGEWAEAIMRFPNRLLDGKGKTSFELRGEPGKPLDVFQLQILRAPSFQGTYLSEMKSSAQKDQSYSKAGISVGGFRFLKGLGVLAKSEMSFALDENFKALEGFAGVDDHSPEAGPIVFRVMVGGEEKFRSPKIQKGDTPRYFYVSLRGAKEFRLIVEGNAAVHADWAEARIEKEKN